MENKIFLLHPFEILECLSLRPYVQDFLHELNASRLPLETTFVHVRLGDYNRGLFNAHNIANDNYYLKAFKVTNGPYEIISNDPIQAKTKIETLIGKEVTVYGLKSMKETFERFIMSSNGIIANSTFSWWGAKMLIWRRAEGNITTPKPWTRFVTSNLLSSAENFITVPYDTTQIHINEIIFILFILLLLFLIYLKNK